MATVVVGRSADADYSIAHEDVSRRHCRFTFQNGTVWVEDLNSSNGTEVDGTRLEEGDRTRVSPHSEVILAGTVVLDWEFIQSLRPQPKRVPLGSSGSDSSGFSMELPELSLPTVGSPTTSVNGPIVAGIAAVVALCAWIGVSYHLHQGRVAEARDTAEMLRQKNAALFENPEGTSFGDLEAYRRDTDSLLSAASRDVSALQGSFTSSLLFGTEKPVAELQDLKQQSEDRLATARRLIEALEQDHDTFKSARQSAESTARSAESKVDVKDGISELQSVRTTVSEERKSVQSVAKQLDQRREKGSFEGDAAAIRASVYENMDAKLTDATDKLSTIEQSLGTAVQYQQDHFDALSAVGAQLVDRSDGIGAVRQNLQPIVQDVDARLQPVQESIQTLEKPIISTGPFGDDVTGLSLIKNVDPATGQAVVLMDDLCEMVEDLESELAKLSRTIGALRNAASGFRSNSSRSEALSIRRAAGNTREYISEKRDLFDPVSSKIDEARGYVDTFDRMVSRVPSGRAQQMLSQFSQSSREVLSLLERPVRLWKGTIGSTIARLKKVDEWESRYGKILGNVASSDYSSVQFSRSP